MRIIAFLLALLTAAALSGCSTAKSTQAGADAPSAGGTNSSSAASTPITSYASAGTITLEQGKTETISKGGSYTVSGTITDGQMIVDTTDKVSLEFAGVSITNSNGAALQILNAKEVTLTLKESTENTLTDGGAGEYNAALFSNDTLIIEGDGKLTVTGNQAHAIESDDDVIVNGGQLVLTAVKDGIHANDNITINGGSIEMAEGYEGIESKGDIIINGGSINLLCSDDGINAATDLTINGGEVYAQATIGDAIDSNGTINLKGGTVVAVGGRQPECGIDCDNNGFSVTGGTLIATGASNSTPTEASSTQCSVSLSGVAANTVLRLEDENGAVFTYQAAEAYQSILVSSPLLENGKSYTIYSGGEVTGGTDFHGLYSDASYSGGTQGENFTISAMVTLQGGSTGMGGGGGHMGGGGGKGMMGGTPPDGVRPDQAPPDAATGATPGTPADPGASASASSSVSAV